MIWVADSSGTSHAHARRTSRRTVCGQAAIDSRYSWPALRTCRDCVAVIERQTGFGLPASK